MALPRRLPPGAADAGARCLPRRGGAFPRLRRRDGRSRKKRLRRQHRVLRAVPLRDVVVPSASREAAQSVVAARCLRLRESGFRTHRRNGGRLVVRLRNRPRDDAFGLELRSVGSQAAKASRPRDRSLIATICTCALSRTTQAASEARFLAERRCGVMPDFTLASSDWPAAHALTGDPCDLQGSVQIAVSLFRIP